MRNIDNSLISIFLRNKKIAESTPVLKRVVSIKEAIDILDTSSSSIRRSIANGDFSEEKEDFRRMGSSVFFDLEAILNRRYMDSETYWYLKEKYELDKLNAQFFESNEGNEYEDNEDSDSVTSSSSNEGCRNLEDINLEILDKVNDIFRKLNEMDK